MYPSFYFIVPGEGLEPSHPLEYTILSRARLPIPPLRQFCAHFRYPPEMHNKRSVLDFLSEINMVR